MSYEKQFWEYEPLPDDEGEEKRRPVKKPKDCTCTGVCLQLTNVLCRDLQPKADPKEKELYSIKDLEWYSENGFWISEELGMHYEVWENNVGYWWRHFDQTGIIKCTSFTDGKRQAQDHFNSKLKLCLNREL